MELNKIYLGDCYELIKQIPDKSIDCVYTDIPYLYEQGGTGNSRISKNIVKMGDELRGAKITDGIDYSIFAEYVRVLKNINIFIWCSRLQLFEIMKWFEENTKCRMQLLVWCKTNPIPACNGNWLSDIEYCLYFNSGTHLNNGYELKSKWYVSKANADDKLKYDHPTIKPLELVKRHILHTTQPDAVVLDTFMGSGTTAVACKETGRKYIGFEINENYWKISIDRLNNIDARGNVSLF